MAGSSSIVGRGKNVCALLIAGLLTVPALAACGSDDAADAPRAADVRSVDRADLRQGGTMTWAVKQLPSTFNVHLTDANAAGHTVAEAVLPTLFPLDKKGRPHADPNYLRKAEVTDTEPHQVVTYTLNPKARWSDGRRIGVRDFVAQWKALNGSQSKFWARSHGGYSTIQSVRRGAHRGQVRVTFKKPFAQWRALFSPLYPKSVMKSPEAFNETTRTRLPVSAGPFRLKSLDRDAGTVRLVRNRHWWGERPKLDALVLREVPADKRLAALRSGRVDLAPLDLDSKHPPLGKVAHNKKLRLYKAAGSAWTQLTLNGGSGPLQDNKVRRAVARAIDRDRIAEKVVEPLGFHGFAPGNHLVMGTQDGYRDNSSALGDVGPDKADAMLDAAGWKKTPVDGATHASRQPAAAGDAAHSHGDSARELRAKDGKPLTLRLLISKHSAQSRTVARQVTRMLHKVGVRTRVQKVSGKSFFTDHVANGKFDLAVFSWPATAFPLADAKSLYAKPRPAADGSMDVGRNYARTGTDEIDLLFRRASSQLDDDKEQELVDSLDARIWREAHSLPLYQNPKAVAARKTVGNAGAFGLRTPDFADLGFTKS